MSHYIQLKALRHRHSCGHATAHCWRWRCRCRLPFCYSFSILLWPHTQSAAMPCPLRHRCPTIHRVHWLPANGNESTARTIHSLVGIGKACSIIATLVVRRAPLWTLSFSTSYTIHSVAHVPGAFRVFHNLFWFLFHSVRSFFPLVRTFSVHLCAYSVSCSQS